MHCLKCGKKVEESHVFCSECMEVMKEHPVKPGTVVSLPQRKCTPVDKKRRPIYHPFRKSADQITMLRNRVRWLTVALIVTFLCFLAMAFLALWLQGGLNSLDLPFLANISCFT